MIKQTVEEAAKECRILTAEALDPHDRYYSIDDCPDHGLSYDELVESSFIKGAEWQAKQSLQANEGKKTRKIRTVQDLIDELMLVYNKDAEINIVMNSGDYETLFVPDLFDFSIIDYTDVHSDDGEAESRVVLQMYR